MNKGIFWSLAAATLWVAGSGLAAAQMGRGGTGPGMMYGAAAVTRTGPNTAAGPGYYGMGRYGMGPGGARGYGAGYGMGPGMMYGYGGGSLYGMGPAMMNGYGGYGPYGMGPGMMYGYGRFGAGALGLSAKQHEQIADIWNNTMQQSWPTMGQLREQYFKLTRLLGSENPDRVAVDKTYGQISDLQLKLLNLRLQARQQTLQVLTAEQRKRLQEESGYHW